MKGGRTGTTWEAGSTWRSGKTKMIRIPIALAPKILEYAKALDRCIFLPPGNGDILNKLIVLQAIDEYIEWKRQNYHPNQNSKALDINTRAWDELRKFRLRVEGGE
jgi:hypothetical protein